MLSSPVLVAMIRPSDFPRLASPVKNGCLFDIAGAGARRRIIRQHGVSPLVASNPSTVSFAALPESCGRAGTCSPVSVVIGSRLLCGMVGLPNGSIGPVVFRSGPSLQSRHVGNLSPRLIPGLGGGCHISAVGCSRHHHNYGTERRQATTVRTLSWVCAKRIPDPEKGKPLAPPAKRCRAGAWCLY